MEKDPCLERNTVGGTLSGRRGPPWGAAASPSVFDHLDYIFIWGGFVVCVRCLGAPNGSSKKVVRVGMIPNPLGDVFG